MHSRAAGFLFVAFLLASCSRPLVKEDFAKIAQEFLYTSLANSPAAATQVGYHRHGDMELDTLLDDFSPASIEKQRQWLQDLRLRLQRSVDNAKLSPEDRADFDIIHDQIALSLLEFDSIRNYRHNPTLYIELIGSALYAPFVLDYAPPETRYQHIISRLEAIPTFVASAKMNLRSAPEIWINVAIEENAGNLGLIEGELRAHVPPRLKPRFEAAAKLALESLRGFTSYLQSGRLSKDHDWRLGPEKYARKFRYVLATDQTPAQVLAAAEAEMEQAREEMQRIAIQQIGSQSIKTALDQIATKHSTAATYFGDAKRDLEEAREFVREKDLLTLPARDNLQVIETPGFMRGIYSVGGFNPAPALQPQLGAFYWLTPIPAEWPKERIESKLREYNYYGLKILTIHEAMPGHYVQFEYANDVDPPLRRVLRAVFGNGPYVEGWAVYATGLLLEQGYLNHSPELRMTFLKQYLRVLANTILDVRLQTMGMSDEEALSLMIQDAYQEREEAEGKLRRAKLSSAQLPTYFVGYRDWQRLRKRAESEGIRLKDFHERALKTGAVPLPILSRLLTGKPL